MRKRFRNHSERYGTDSFSMFTCSLACVLLLLSVFLSSIVSEVLWVLALTVLLFSYYRIFSKNIERRRMENEWFLRRVSPVTRFIARQKTKHRQKNLYCFFKCPKCGTVLRVPKGKGKLRITCKNCLHVFERVS